MSVTIAGIEFKSISYDEPVDVLYLHVIRPGTDRDWDETGEGDGVSYDELGNLNGFTLLSPRLRLEEDGHVELTLPEQQVVATGLDALLLARAA